MLFSGQGWRQPNRFDGDFQRVTRASVVDMRLLLGGKFLMGNDRNYGFPIDGEGPSHQVQLKPFWIDVCTVTNEQYNNFVNATRYKTETEPGSCN